jgi:hypothetical protein
MESLVAKELTTYMSRMKHASCLMISAKCEEMPMGGPGSGRWPRWETKDTVEHCLSLDVRARQRGH